MLVFLFVAALLYMPLPIVAGLIVEKRAGRGYLLGVEKRTIRRNIGRVALISFTTAIAIYLANLGMTLLLGNVLGVPGVGKLVSTQAAMLAAIAAVPARCSGADERRRRTTGRAPLRARASGRHRGRIHHQRPVRVRRGVRLARRADGRAQAAGRRARQPAHGSDVGAVARADHPARLQLRRRAGLGHPHDVRGDDATQLHSLALA